ncbi:hypothetical protein CP061683_1178B, partial [Chlamydia psittaci 06-1683]
KDNPKAHNNEKLTLIYL